MTGKKESTLSDVIVVGYQWRDDGHVTVTVSWAPGRRCTYSVPAPEFNDRTVDELRRATLTRLQRGEIK